MIGELKVNPDIVTHTRGRTALHAAVQGSNVRVVEILVRAKANPMAADADLARTPVFYAVLNSEVEALRMLMSQGPRVDIDEPRFDGMTPLRMLQELGKQGRTPEIRAMESIVAKHHRITYTTDSCAWCGKRDPEVVKSRCAGCKHYRYCNKTCQVAHWKHNHKVRCKELKYTYARYDEERKHFFLIENTKANPKDVEAACKALKHVKNCKLLRFPFLCKAEALGALAKALSLNRYVEGGTVAAAARHAFLHCLAENETVPTLNEIRIAEVELLIMEAFSRSPATGKTIELESELDIDEYFFTLNISQSIRKCATRAYKKLHKKVTKMQQNAIPQNQQMAWMSYGLQ